MLLLDSPERLFRKRPSLQKNFLIHDTETKTCVKLFFDLLKTKRICFTWGISPYRAVNTFHHGFKKNNLLMTYKAKVAVCSEISTKHSTLSEHHVEFLIVKPGGT